MKPFRDISIDKKLLVMALFKCGMVLLISITPLFIFQIWNFRTTFERDTAVLAAIIGGNSTAAITFNDPQSAKEVIHSLQVKPNVRGAYLLLPDGSLFAQLGDNYSVTLFSEIPSGANSCFNAGQLLFRQPINLDHKHIGTLYLQLDYKNTFNKLLEFYGLLVLAVVVISIAFSLFLNKILRRSITDPVQTLAAAAKRIGRNQDYSIRVDARQCEDEIGQLTQEFNQMVEHIGMQEKILQENREKELNESREKLSSLIHSIDGIVWECRPHGSYEFTFASTQMERILGYPPKDCLKTPGFWEEKIHPEDAAQTLQTYRDMVESGQSYTQEYRVQAADGHWVWIRESGRIMTENGKATAVVGIYQDVSEQKKAAEQVEKLNQKLFEASRYAGMAEVATGVLHNVGNVLNSVSVSATLVNEQMRRSKSINLRRGLDLLRENNNHLAEFLTADPKGRLLPDYLCRVGDELATEQAQTIEEMTSVGQHIEHIKEIVAMQQSYARVSGALEIISSTDLVEDALRMNTGAFQRHQIQIKCQMGDALPRVCVDRHKVLQILINLFRNAKYALDAKPSADKQLTIQTVQTNPDIVSIIVRDNGIGIAPENLIKIFNHGFTTKRDGHGFGLHSGANAAKEMGGSLTAESNGPGLGATFTLELPIAKIKPNASY